MVHLVGAQAAAVATAGDAIRVPGEVVPGDGPPAVAAGLAVRAGICSAADGLQRAAEVVEDAHLARALDPGAAEIVQRGPAGHVVDAAGSPRAALP